jgi:hypothetical protein
LVLTSKYHLITDYSLWMLCSIFLLSSILSNLCQDFTLSVAMVTLLLLIFPALSDSTLPSMWLEIYYLPSVFSVFLPELYKSSKL